MTQGQVEGVQVHQELAEQVFPWDFLTGRQAEISYHLDDVVVEVPRDTGPTSPRATWRFAGTISVTTSDDTTRRGADPS